MRQSTSAQADRKECSTPNCTQLRHLPAARGSTGARTDGRGRRRPAFEIPIGVACYPRDDAIAVAAVVSRPPPSPRRRPHACVRLPRQSSSSSEEGELQGQADDYAVGVWQQEQYKLHARQWEQEHHPTIWRAQRM